MRRAGAVLAACHEEIKSKVKPGVTTLELNDSAVEYLNRCGAEQVIKGYKGFPYEICASVNDVIAHGFPDTRPLRSGDIVKIDIVCRYNGWLADMTRTYTAGKASAQAIRLIQVTKECLEIGIQGARAGRTIGDMMHPLQRHAENAGYSVVTDLVGHGIGRSLHEKPFFPHTGKPGRGVRLKEGMVITIEPMINEGVSDIFLDTDGWTVRTFDGKLSAQFEDTVAITKDGPLVLTAL